MKPQENECRCEEDSKINCAYCTRLGSKGYRYIEANGEVGVGLLVEERDALLSQQKTDEKAIRELHEEVSRLVNKNLELREANLQGAKDIEWFMDFGSPGYSMGSEAKRALELIRRALVINGLE